MTHRVLSVLYAALAVVGIGVGVRVVIRPLANVPTHGATAPRVPMPDTSPRRTTDSLAMLIVAQDAFRLTRRPASVVYDPLPTPPPEASAPAKPVLILTGIVWNARDPVAILTGLPASSSPRVVYLGEHVGPLKIDHIAADQVVVTGLDTVWTLTVREPWR
jgi:hypothetical protein